MTGAMHPVILAAGGTGGHVFPAQALAEALLGRGHALALITDRRGADYGGALGGMDTYRISAGRVGGGVIGAARGILALGLGFIQARGILRRLSPAAVIGFGGYPSLPTMVAASRAAIPTLIHEQNAVLGRANRLLKSRVARIATSFPSVAGLGPADADKVVHTGNPVREAIAALHAAPYEPPVQDGPVRILVTGGSQGAHVMSEVLPAAVSRLPEGLRHRLEVSQQCRSEDLDAARAKYGSCGVRAELAGFFDDVPARLGAAHLVIGRAGASTVAEFAAAGRPAILVPYPHAIDDHQTANARALEAAGAAWLMPQEGFTAESLAERLQFLAANPDILSRAAAAARETARPDAATRLADAVDTLAGPREAAA